MPAFRLATVTIGRIHFDLPLGQQQAAIFRHQAEQRGYTLEGPEEPLTDLAAAQAAGRALCASQADLLVIFQATFADSQMLLALSDALDLPVFLWAPPEQRSHERLHLASFCGLNLAAHALGRQGKPYFFAYSSPQDDSAWRKLETAAAAGRVRRLLKSTRLGVVGERPPGMDTCDLSETDLSRLGVQVDRFTLSSLFDRIQAPDQAALVTLHQELNRRLDGLEEMASQPVERTLAAALALRELAQAKKLSGLAVRCWPEFFSELGCSACGALSLLSDACIPATCEADSNGAISQLIMQWLSGAPAFNSDVVEVDVQRDEIVLWHCGQAPLSLAAPGSRPRGVLHSNRKLPFMMDFALKPGPVTLLRLSTAGGDGLKLVAGQGELLDAPKAFTGTSGVLRFERPAAEFLERFIGLGMEHHIALAYGSFLPELEALAHLLGLPFVRL